MSERWRRNFCLPTYTPAKWWECDVFELSESGYFREYEVKLSRADFRADAQKSQRFGSYGTGWETHKKHDLLAARDSRGPVQFWFVTPAGLLTLDEIPEWAGLIEMREYVRTSPHTGEPYPGERPRLMEKEIKKAPRLHKEKFGKREGHARGICYWRMHGALGIREPHWSIDEPEAVSDGLGI